MPLIRWEPSEGLSSLRRELDRLFEDFIERGPFRGGDRGWEPAVEVADTKDAVVVKAQVPGISKDNLQVNVTDNTLTLLRTPAAIQYTYLGEAEMVAYFP